MVATITAPMLKHKGGVSATTRQAIIKNTGNRHLLALRTWLVKAAAVFCHYLSS
jgi:hypothetical protein